MDISSDLSVKTDPLSTYNFWLDLYDKYGIPPYETF